MNPIALAGSDTVPSSMSSPLSSHQSQLLQARGWGLSPSSPGSRPPGAKSRPPGAKTRPPGAKTRPPGAKFAGHLTRCSLIPWCLYVWAVSYLYNVVGPPCLSINVITKPDFAARKENRTVWSETSLLHKLHNIEKQTWEVMCGHL